MTTAVEKLLDSFDHLSEIERRDAIAAILLRSARLEYPPLTDDELTAIAEERFLELDAQETSDGSH